MGSGAPIVVVGGNIATGKSTLVLALGEHYALPTFRERWEQNPWFGLGLETGFQAQLWFLTNAAADHFRLGQSGGIQERSVYEHADVFAYELLTHDQAQAYRTVFELLERTLPSPTLFIYLHAPPAELLSRIRGRGRPQERSLDLRYLEALDVRYGELVESWTRSPVLEVDTTMTDTRTPIGQTDVLRRAAEVIP